MLSKVLRMHQEKELSALQDEAAKPHKSLEEKDVQTLLKEKVEKTEKENDEARKIHNADVSKLKK